ncbi:MAG: hypothetical protein QM770_00620 [Tepidisphaeraceae bacterium]
MRIRTYLYGVVAVIGLTAALAAAYSPIGNLNGYSAAQLAKAGLTVRPATHPVLGESPPQKWVEATLDCAAVPNDRDITVTVWYRSNTGQTLAAIRAGRAEAIDGKIRLTFVVPPDATDLSELVVFTWNDQPMREGDMVGFKVSLPRLAALADAVPTTRP